MNDGGTRLVKYGAAALLLALYAVLSSWIVAGEGEAYRKAIASKANDVVVAKADPVEPPEKERPAEPAPETAPETAPEPIVQAPPPQQKKAKAQPKAMPPPKPPAEPATRSKAQPKAPPAAVDPIWDAPEQKKVWDLDKLTVDDERSLGASIHELIMHVYPELEDGPLPRRVAEAAKPYLKNVARKDVDYTFTVLDTPLLNAFSHPGGYIYVTRGLFEWIGEDEDYALGFILAHEIAHVDMGHAILCLRDPAVKEKFKIGTNLLFFAVMIPGGYLNAQDLEADKWAATQMMKAGRTRYETLAFLRRLEDYARSSSFENKRKTPKDKPEVPPLDNHIRAHLIPRDRLEALKAFIGRFQ